MKKGFAQRLRSVRGGFGISQFRLASAPGVHESYVAKWEAEAYDPSETLKKRIAQFFPDLAGMVDGWRRACLSGESFSFPCSCIWCEEEGRDDAIVACLVLRDGMTATREEVIDYRKGRLVNCKVPRRVEFMKELPVTPATNKVEKVELVQTLKEAR